LAGYAGVIRDIGCRIVIRQNRHVLAVDRNIPGSAFFHQPENEQDQHCAKNGADPAHWPSHAESSGSEIANEGTGNAKKASDNQPARVAAGHEEFCDDADYQADDKGNDEVHDCSFLS
jgi:hypothetical protein